MIAGLVLKQAQHMEGIRMLRACLENLPVYLSCFLKSPCPVLLYRKIKLFLEFNRVST